MIRFFAAAFAAAFCAVTAEAAPDAAAGPQERRVALIIGNGAYENAAPLANPVRDAKAIAGLLTNLGFETVEGYDLGQDGLRATVRTFARESADADLTLFYYAGHGIGFAGRNYLVPVDARFEDATALDFEATPVDFVTKQMRYSDGVSLVLLDACRDNPLANTLTRSLGLSSRSAVTRGLATMDLNQAGRGLAIAFATSPGEVAYDGAGDHSPFTTALLTHLKTPGTDFTEVMSRVTGDVLEATGERQRPWLNASLTGPVVLNPERAAAPATPAIPGPEVPLAFEAGAGGSTSLEAQTLLFNLARESGLASDYRAYLETFPSGLYAVNARQAIAALGEDDARGGTAEEREVAALTPALAPALPAEAAPSADAAPPAVAVPPAEAAPPAEAVETDGALQASAETEAALGLDRSARREVQDRLNLAGADVGGADGVFGPRTRAGLRRWQVGAGFAETGYLDASQLSALEEATSEAFAALKTRRATAAREAREARQARQRAANARRSTKRAAPTRQTKRRAAPARQTARRAAPQRAASQRKAPAKARVEKSNLDTQAGWRNRRRLTPAQMDAAMRAARQ